MKSDSNSGLYIKQIIVILIILVTVSTSIQLFIYRNTNVEVANTNINVEEKIIENVLENIIEEKTEIARRYERELESTTRGSKERILEEEKETYISIDEIEISFNMDLTKRCGISKEDFKTLMTNLKSDTTGFFEENSDTIYDLCKKYEINEIFFCGLIAAESGWKISSGHRRANNYVSMMSKGRLIRYDTPAEGLEAAAKLLHNNYLTEGGSYYYGKTISCVQRRYCPGSSTWVNLVYGCMKYILK